MNYQDDRAVAFFSVPYEALNNWSAHKVEIWSISFPTAEHAYQWKKFSQTAPDVAEKILSAPSPWATYQINKANHNKSPKNWNEQKLGIMLQIISAKLDQHKDVQERLLATGNRQIIENSPWDTFWGAGPEGKDQNNLGKLWMQLRNYLN